MLREAGNSVLYYGRIVFTSLVDLVRGREKMCIRDSHPGTEAGFAGAAHSFTKALRRTARLTVYIVGFLL